MMTSRSLLAFACAALLGCGGSHASPATATSTAAAVTSAPSGVGTTTSGSGTAPASTSTTTTTTPPAANFVGVAFETLDVGPRSPRGVAQGAHEAQVGTAPDWASFWPTHSQAPLPRVDFGTESVLGTFMRELPGSEPFTRVIGVERDTASHDLRAVVREFERGPWRPAVRVLTSPFHLVRCQTAISGQGSLTVTRQRQLDFERLAAGSNSALGANDPTFAGGLHVFRDAAAYMAFYTLIQPAARPPLVDFQREMAVIVLGPYVASFGNSVATQRLIHDPRTDEIRVRYRINPYQGGAAPPPATETPFQVLRVSLAGGPIRAERAQPVTLTPLATGATRLYRGLADARVFRDAAAFSAYWSANVGGAPPVVDFARDQVLLAIEAASTGRMVSVARAEGLEDDELAVSVHTQAGIGVPPASGAAYSVVTTPRTLGPVGFETRDVTPRP